MENQTIDKWINENLGFIVFSLFTFMFGIFIGVMFSITA